MDCFGQALVSGCVGMYVIAAVVLRTEVPGAVRVAERTIEVDDVGTTMRSDPTIHRTANLVRAVADDSQRRGERGFEDIDPPMPEASGNAAPRRDDPSGDSG